MKIKDFKKKASFKKIQNLNKEYPKYLSSLLNYINGTMASSQTSPKKVGQMTELIEKYKKETIKEEWSASSWKEWYLNEKVLPDGTTGREAFDRAVDKNMQLITKAKEMLSQNDIEFIVSDYLKDLIFEKTYKGLMIEEFVCVEGLKLILGNNVFNNNLLIKSNKQQESKNIDFIYNNIKLQIKPISFKGRNKGVQLGDYNDIVIIYYEIEKNDINITFKNKELLK